MSRSTNGELCYGIIFEDGYEFPWDDREKGYCGDHDEWYIAEVLKMIFESYSDRFDYMKTNPMPFEVLNYCSGEYPMYILAVRGTVKTARRGDPVTFDPKDLVVDEEAVDKFLEFCKEHELVGESPIGWHLTSYEG